MAALNVALVGCGRIADLHVLGYRGEPRARLYALCDTDPEVLERRRKEWGVEQVTSDYAALLRDPALDAVELLTPQPLHEEMAIAALRAGKHVAVQKPVANDLAATDRMLRAAESSGRVFKVTENYVFYPPILRARELLEGGAIGQVLSLRIQYLGGTSGGWEVPSSSWEWRLREARAGRGFATFDHGHHLLSTAWFLLGSPERVFARIDSSDGLVDCPATFVWTCEGQPLRQGTCHFVHAEDLRVPSDYYCNDEWIEVYGSKGFLRIARCTGKVHPGPPLVLYDGQGFQTFDVDSDWAAGFVGATKNFIAAMRGEEEPLLSGSQSREILRFSLALLRSAKLGREVWVQELDRRFPSWYAFWRGRRERGRRQKRPGLLERLGLRSDVGRLAPMALPLTRELLERFDPGPEGVPDTCIGLVLEGDGLETMQLGLIVCANEASLLEGSLPEGARLVVRMRPSVWAAVLLRERRIELAALQGQLRFTGKAEEALGLKKAFGF